MELNRTRDGNISCRSSDYTLGSTKKLTTKVAPLEMPMCLIKQSKVTGSELVENSGKEADVAPKSEADSGKGTSFSTTEAKADSGGNELPLLLRLRRIAKVKPTHLSHIQRIAC